MQDVTVTLTPMQHTTVVAALARIAVEYADPSPVIDALNVLAPTPVEPWAALVARLRMDTNSDRVDEAVAAAADMASADRVVSPPLVWADEYAEHLRGADETLHGLGDIDGSGE